MPLFSIVIPTFNRSDLFPYAVRSILNQTFEDFEIIISDNCSDDDTAGSRQAVHRPAIQVRPDSAPFHDRRRLGIRQVLRLGQVDHVCSRTTMLWSARALRTICRRIDRAMMQIFYLATWPNTEDRSYPGPDQNSVDCPRFSATSRVVHRENEFIGPLFSFRPKFIMHPSAFVFPKTIADYVASRTGRFFWTNGVEYSAWPITAVFCKEYCLYRCCL